MRTWKLTTIIGSAITGLVAFSALLVALPLYSTFDKQLVREFNLKALAEGREVSVTLSSQLEMVRERVNELTLDNNIRVPLMLDVGFQLRERLITYDDRPVGTSFFVLGAATGRMETSAPAMSRTSGLARSYLSGYQENESVSRSAEGQFAIGFTRTIERHGQKIGTALALNIFSPSSLAIPPGSKLIYESEQGSWDFLTGLSVDLRLAGVEMDMTQASLEGGHGILVPMPTQPDIMLFVPRTELDQTRQSSMSIAILLSLLTIAIGIAVSFLLAKLFARPLRAVAASARRVADGVAEPAELANHSHIVELGQFSESLLEIVHSLRRAEELKRYQELFDSVGEAVCLLGRDGRIIETNEVAPLKFGISRREFLKANVYDFVAEKMHGDFRAALEEVVDSGEPQVIETNCLGPDGKVYETSHHMRRIELDNTPAILSVNIDITQRKRMERDLIASKQHAENANRAKTEFMANMSHEIRTPLNAVMGLLEVLSESDLDEEQTTCVQVARRSANSLLTVIGDILDITKVEAGKLMLCHDRFLSADLFQSVQETFSTAAEHKGLDFQMNIDPLIPDTLTGDAGRIRQVLFNLVGNAVKFTEAGGVKVAASLVSSTPGHDRVRVLFSISDTGIGIPEEMTNIIFDVFTQADGSYSRNFQGTGLGLGLVKRLVDMMGGTLDLDSTVGKGTTIYVSLSLATACTSLAPPAPVELTTAASTLETPGQKSLLVVEDNASNRMTIEAMLRRLGYSVLLAEDGKQALELLASHPVDLVLMDIQMPVMDGMETTRIIRALENPTLAAVPIIAVTAHAMQGDRERFLAAGMDEYIAKPVRKVILAETLSRMLRKDQPQ